MFITGSRLPRLVLMVLAATQFGNACAQGKIERQREELCAGDTVDRLGPQAAGEARAFVAGLKAAVDRDDRKAVSSMVRYPLSVQAGNRAFRIHTPAEFLRFYDRILNSGVRKAIDDPKSSTCLFFNPDGYMIGDGEVWFLQNSEGVFKIITFNPDSLPPANTK